MRYLILLLMGFPSFVLAESGGTNVAANLSVLFQIAAHIGAMMGFFLFGYGIYGFYDHSKNPGREGISRPILQVITGVLLISSGWFYELMKGSFVGDSDGVSMLGGQMHLALDVEAARASGSISQAGLYSLIPETTVTTLLAFVYLVGFIFFLVGVSKIRNISSNSKEGGLMQPIMNILGGVICMNITYFGCFGGKILGTTALCI